MCVPPVTAFSSSFNKKRIKLLIKLESCEREEVTESNDSEQFVD